MENPDPSHLAAAIESTLLRQDATRPEIEKLCEDAAEHNLCAVCVPPFFVNAAAGILSSTPISVVTVAGFPMGYTTMQAKAEETRKALGDGADEIDMVLNLSAFKSGNISYVKDEINRLATLCHLQARLLKVIIETVLLSEEEIAQVCALCVQAEADFVKTSTGFAGGGTTLENVSLIRSIVPPNVRIKAAGGIRDREFAERLISAGADRIGTSNALGVLGI